MITALLGNFGLTRLQAEEYGRELISDPHFQNGFRLIESKPGKRIVYGAITEAGSAGPPVWDLGQWSSKYPLKAEVAKRQDNGVFCFTNVGKEVLVGVPGSAQADLTFGLNAGAEYGDRARKSAAEPWVHLLAMQDIVDPPALAGLTQCTFHIEARLLRSVLYHTNDYTPALHAAQFTVFLAVANRNRKSSGYGQYLWFGVPVYDNRSRIVPTFQEKDFGGTDMFIYTLASDVFTKESTHDHQWVTINTDVLPLMRQGLQTGWKRGFMPGSTNLADYHITGIFLGWEVPGIFDVEMQLRNLSLIAIPASRERP